MPAISGTEDPLEHRRLTDSYFKIINEEWQPKIIDDPLTLPSLSSGEKYKLVSKGNDYITNAF